MDFVLHSMGLPFNGETIKSKSLGGSESAAYYLARELAARGHQVKMFTSEQTEGVWDGVTYIWHGNPTSAAPLGERFCHYAENTPHDVLIIQRHPLAFHRDYASKLNIWQLHDLALFRSKNVIHGGLSRINMVTTVSEWHKNQVHEVYGINKDSIFVVPNGVDPSLYNRSRHTAEFEPREQFVKEHKGFKMLYQSRPERGMVHLVKPGGIMDRLKDTHPDIHLFICGYDNVTQEMAPFYQQLADWGNALPNVTHLGSLTKQQLADVQTNCHLLCYPTEFEEVSCITAMEAMQAYLPMLTSNVGALAETCEGSGTILIDLNDGEADEDAFVSKIQELFDNWNNKDASTSSTIAVMHEKQRSASVRKTWGHAADILLEQISKIFESKSDGAMLTHLIEHGDIIAAEKYMDSLPENKGNLISMTLSSLDSMYDFSHSSPDVLNEHYESWEAKAIDDAGGEENVKAGIGGVQTTTRFSGIAQFVEEAVNNGAKRILEFGCSYGHILLPFAERYPEVEFVGVDFVPQSIKMAKEKAQEIGLKNISFYCGSHEFLDAYTDGFDAVIAAEVWEHIRDHSTAAKRFLSSLKMGGSLIITTPYGRWEWTGHENYKWGREHLHHFERKDILEIFGSMPLQILCAPAGKDHAHKPLGSWVYRIIKDDSLPNQIDYSRKFAETLPRQTVSLCMIVKDGEKTLKKAIESIITYVDEVVIKIDPKTTDRTREVLQQLQDDNPCKPFHISEGLSPLEHGFDAARNASIDEAGGDWIFWMDADEEVVGADNLHRLLVPSSFNAYGIAQIHYSAQPAQVLTTDYPARLFRNNRGVRFYGLVHEHPEDEPGKSISYTAVNNDIKLVHFGYIDEATRRKRFVRNYPLLLKDVETYPNRTLNKFLMLRDIAQSIGFEMEVGTMTREQEQRAMKGIELFREIVKLGYTRMIVDAMSFYSICVSRLNVGFEADVIFKSKKDSLKDSGYSLNAKGMFYNADDYLSVVNLIAKESIANYDSKYL